MFFDVTAAKHLQGYRISLEFRDGSSGIVDLAGYAAQDNVFRAFRDDDYFRGFRVELGTLVWGEGELDIAPEPLYEKATGRIVAYSQSRV